MKSMKTEDSQNDQSNSFVQASSMSLNSSNIQKYGGLIEQNLYKKTVKQLTSLFDYVYSVSPSYKIVHYVITVLRLLQFAGPSFCAAYGILWSNEDSAADTISILSIFFHLIPPAYQQAGRMIFIILYLVILSLIIVFLIVSAMYFHANADLPKIIPPFITFYFATFGHIFHPIAFEIGLGTVGSVILCNHHEKVLAISLVFVLFIFVSSTYFWIYLKIACQTLIFRPNSIVTVSMQPQVLIFASQLLVTCLLAFPESNSTSHILITLILIILAGIIYFASIGIAFIYGGIVNPIATAAFIATCFTSGLMCFANAITILIGKQSNLLYIVSFVIIYFISNITTLFLWNRKKTKNLELLDEIIDEASYFDCIRNVNQFVNIAVDGFYHAHPACINWSFLKLGLEKWPSHQMVWFIYAKFSAIYPEETQTLGWIYNTIINNKVKGSSAKTVKEQSVNIGRQRESNLSNDLKVKLNTVSKHITSAKHKLRHV